MADLATGVQPPPSHSAINIGLVVNNPNLPPDTAPIHFHIGTPRTTTTLVGIQQIKGHLFLLHAFSELKKEIEGDKSEIPNVPINAEKRWGWFVALAVERFEIWCHGLKPQDDTRGLEIVLPPLDVIMVWHSYMLNPRWYGEDCIRLPPCRILKTLGLLFANGLDGQIQEIFSKPPSEARLEYWMSRTCPTLAFDYKQSMHETKTRLLLCPYCRKPIACDLMSAQGRGYLQMNFKICCPSSSCKTIEITKGKLALRKLAEDLAAPHSNNSCMPGTLFHTPSPTDKEAGKQIKVSIREAAVNYGQLLQTECKLSESVEKLCISIMRLSEYSLANLRDRMSTPSRLLAKIMNAYNDDKIFSVDLVGAVLRQGSFVKKMYDLQWTQPKYFDDAPDELALQHCLTRYHAFLNLMASSPASLFVPTLDIDLVWHTHQLLADKYEQDCLTYVGRFIDHDDKVEGVRLSSAFDITCAAWKERFHVEYAHCGCPIPGDTIGQRLARLISLHDPVPASYLMPLDRLDSLSATHPSDHNAVRFEQHTNPAQLKILNKYYKVAKEKQKAFEKALEKRKAASRRSAGASAGGGAGPGSGSRHTWGPSHQSHVQLGSYPFLFPVPLYLGGDLRVGALTTNVGSCVAAYGTVIDPVGGCANCSAGGCGGGACGGGGHCAGTGAASCGACVGGYGGRSGGAEGGGRDGDGGGGDGGGVIGGCGGDDAIGGCGGS